MIIWKTLLIKQILYSGSASLDILPVFFYEFVLGTGIIAGLLFLAYFFTKEHTFGEQKAIAVLLANGFSFSLWLQGSGKWFFSSTGYSEYLIETSYTSFLEGLVALAGGFLLYFSIRLIQTNRAQHLMEYPILFTLSLWFLQLLILSNHMLLLFIGLVGFSLNLYVMIMVFGPTQTNQVPIHETARQEASIKYFYWSTFSSSLILVSLVLFFAIAQTVNLIEFYWSGTCPSTIPHQFVTFFFEPNQRLATLAVAALLIGFTFKMAAVPSHTWAPEVYQGSSNSVTAFIILPVKIAALGIFITLFLNGLHHYIFSWTPFLQGVAGLSLVIGAVAAFTEKKIKKFLAYSSINQIGFMLLGVCTTTSLLGTKSTIFFLIIYVLTNLLFFYFFLQMESKKSQRPLVYLTDLTKLGPKNYLVKFCWTLVFFSLAGIPPFAGFFSKFYLLLVAQNHLTLILVLTGILTSLISGYYYLRVLKQLWFELDNVTSESLFVGKENSGVFFYGDNLKFVIYAISCLFFSFFITLFFIWNSALLKYCSTWSETGYFPLNK